MNAEAQAILSRAAACEGKRQPAACAGNIVAETALLLELARLRDAYRAAEAAQNVRESGLFT